MTYTLNEKRKPLAENPVLSEADRTELAVLLCLQELGCATAAELARAALCTESDAQAALQFWRGARMVRVMSEGESAPIPAAPESESEAKKSEPRKIHAALRHEMKLAPMNSEYTASLIEEHRLSAFLDACQQTAGQIFSPHEIEITVGLHHQLGLSPEYILTLIAYCYGMEKRSMSYVEKVAFSFVVDRGIDTEEKLIAHIDALDRMHSAEGKLRALFGMGDRALTKREKDAFFKWMNDFSYGLDMIEAAYDKTVNNTGKASVAYADKILSHWHASGCKTPADAEALDAREAAALPDKKKKAEKEAAEREREKNRSFNGSDIDDIFSRALARSYGKSEEKKKNGGSDA